MRRQVGVLLGFVVGEDRVIEHNWSNEIWTRGCYAGYMPPGVWSDFGSALCAPVGRIHWAGTETSEVFNGYMDGAVRSGERAAAERRRRGFTRVARALGCDRPRGRPGTGA
jgi:monoamine oxidase